MSTQVQRRKGTTAQHASFTGASAELTVDTTKNTVVVHDGVTAGGIPLAKETGSAISVTSFTSSGAASIETTDNTNAALRITQLGTGNALLVEDSANPDASPVVITNNGTLVVGNTARVASSSLIEAHSPAAVSGTPAIATYSWGTPAVGGSFNLYKSRSGTVGTQALVAANTQSSVRFYFDDGVAFQQGASIIGMAEGTPALNSMPGRLTFNTTAAGSVTPTERMRIDSNGDITIASGTANGVTYLNSSKVLTSGTALTFDGTNLGVSGGVGVSIKNISASTQANLRLGSTFSGGGGNNTDWSIIQSFSAYGDLVFRSGTAEGDDPRVTGSTRFQFLKDGTSIWNVAGSEAMRLTSTGLGIGTTSPSASAILDAQSTTKGVRMPNMTTTQKNAIASPAAGLMVFDTTLAKLCVYTGAAWQTITSV